MRYAQVVGILTALLADDRELVEAINAACHERREEAGKYDLPEGSEQTGPTKEVRSAVRSEESDLGRSTREKSEEDQNDHQTEP